ncbi:MAG: NAD(P)/FAD-dependent oxidoreductase [Myxococcota bacterium]
MEQFDLVVLGAGPAGIAAAIRAHDLGRSVLVIERDKLGGAGIHNGALSSKTLWELAKDYATACRVDRGYRAENVTLSYAAVTATVRAAEGERRQLFEREFAGLAVHGPGKLAVRAGTGRFVSPTVVRITAADGSTADVTASFFLVATGSRPRALPGIVADGVRVLTSDHLEALPEFPESLVVIGAGVVGCEYATIFSRFGRTKVHLLDREARILPFEDEDVSEVIEASFREMGLTLHHHTRLASLSPRADGVTVNLIGPSGPTVLEASHVLLSVGRVPNTDDLGLAEAGVQLTPGGVIVAEDTRTSVPHIYGAGDTTADIAVANVAELEGRHAVERMFGLDPKPLSYGALSSILFLAPEVASVGMNEQQAKAAGVPYRVAVVHNALVARNVAMRATRGFVKLLARPDGRLIGIRVVGPQASSTIQGVALLIDRGGTVEDLVHCFHPHPSIPEGVQECARLLLGRSLYKPEIHPGALRLASG